MIDRGATAGDVREVVALGLKDAGPPPNHWAEERAVELLHRAAGDALAGRPPSPRMHDP